MLHKETVEPRTLDILKQCMKASYLSNFVLVGGTALSLQFGHRISIDLDFFGETEFLNDENFTEEFNKIGSTVLTSKSNVMLGYFVDNLKIDIVKYKYPLIRKVIEIEGIRLASPEDIGAMKLAAITGRGKKKDFVDLFYLLKVFSLKELISFYDEKFPDGNKMLVYRSIAYFEDADKDPDALLLNENITWSEMKSSLIEKTHLYLNE